MDSSLAPSTHTCPSARESAQTTEASLDLLAYAPAFELRAELYDALFSACI
jgi:hypothetical protein